MAEADRQMNYWFGTPGVEMRPATAGGGPGAIAPGSMAAPDMALENITARPTLPLNQTRSANWFLGPSPEASTSDAENIVGAAVKFKNQFYTGPNHMAAIEAAAKANKIPFRSMADREAAIDAMEDTEGFLTNTGRYVNRQEAADIANKADQLKSPLREKQLWAQDLKKIRK
jgi:hypothetical protein